MKSLQSVNRVDQKDCTGCGACRNICPCGAVTMTADREGFRYPEVDPAKCAGCGICLRVCPAETPGPENAGSPECFACRSRNRETRIASTSGGIFTELAKEVLARGGAVAGARYAGDFSVRHAVVFSEEELAPLRRSKYLQSDTGAVYRQTELLLKKGMPVLFSGTPCQNAALRLYLGRPYPNLVRCDFICRGVASPKVFRMYLDMLEQERRSRVRFVQFKNKDRGWHGFGTRIGFANGDSLFCSRYEDPFMVGYLERNLFLRPSCHSCRFRGAGEGDVTLGDFWGAERVCPELDDDLGTSAVLLNSAAGREIFERIKPRVVWKPCTREDILRGNPCMEGSVPEGKDRRRFFDELDRRPFRELARKYAAPSGPRRLAGLLRRAAGLRKPPGPAKGKKPPEGLPHAGETED